MEPLEIALRSARATYRAEEKKDPTLDGGKGFSPAAATKKAAEKSGIPASRLVPFVAGVYYEENGSRRPISGKGAALARAIAKRRKAGGRFARWEVLAASLAAGETPRETYPIATIRALAEKGGVDLAASYTGRGTRIAAPKTKADETAEANV